MSHGRTLGSFIGVVARQLANDRTALFFYLALPIIVIVVVGSTFGNSGESLRIGVTGAERSTSGQDIVAELGRADGVEIITIDDADAASRAIRRQSLNAAILFPADLDMAVRQGGASLPLLVDASSPASVVVNDIVGAAVSKALRSRDTARTVATESAIDYDTALDLTTELEQRIAEVGVQVDDVGTGPSTQPSPFSLTASQNLVLFVFINSMAGAGNLVSLRRSGVLRRVLAGPTDPMVVIVGLASAWFVLALAQSAIVLVLGALVFGVDWGDPLAALLLTFTFAAVGAGAALFVGAVFEDPDRVSAVGPPAGLVLGALGGCMVPLEVFPQVMRTVALFTPQYWAVSAWQQLMFDGAGLAAVAPRLGVLLAWSAVLLALAATRLQMSFTR